MQYENVKIISFNLNVGELHNLKDYEHINPVIECETESGTKFTARMRLHISEPLDELVFADPLKFPDEGYTINSTGSKVIARRENYTAPLPENIILKPEELKDVILYKIDKISIQNALLDGYNFDYENEEYHKEKEHKAEIAFTCHDPNIIGGGNVILFRLINWLDHLGIKVTVYSCGTPPSWMRVNARFKCFKTYKEMFSEVKERIVIVYSMWHIEPVLKFSPKGKLVYHIRQIYEPFHYCKDYDSMIARKPAIEMLESLKIGLITISPHLEDYYRRLHNLDSFLISNGLDPKVFYPTAKGKRKENEIKIVSVGNPNHFVKGSTLLYKALKILALRKKNMRIFLQILKLSRLLDLNNLRCESNIQMQIFSLTRLCMKGMGFPQLRL
jgi:glycosyltransferase involved in cell wall biosynthesis